MGLLNLAGLVASLWFPIVGLAVGVILIFFIYRLAAALHTMAWLYAIAAIVPVVGLFSLLHLDRMATRALQKADLKVGLMGVTEEELPISVTGIIPSSSAGATTMLEKGEKHMKASGVFLAVLAAIAVAVFIFAPERLPSGIGLVPVPMEVRTRPSLAGEGQVAIISNPTGKTLHNVLLFCRNSSTNEEKTYLEETWVPGKSIEIGWVEGWRFLSGETLTISASGYASKTWNW